MRKRFLSFILGALFASMLFLGDGASQQAHGDSIWARRSSRYGFLFSDNRARQVGDILTVLISETSLVGQREQRQLNKSHESGGKFNLEGSTTAGRASRSAQADLEIDSSSRRLFNGNAQFNSNRQFTDRMAVHVVDVLPNGNMVIEGHRIRMVSDERRLLRITGIVRPADLTPNNTVQSEVIANFKIEYEGRGVETSFTNQGWFNRMWNVLWPF